jgi:pyruvate dehydrogenase E1 component alpha subunit
MKTKAAESSDLSAGARNGFSLISPAKLRQLHATMLQCRAIEEHAKTLPRTKRARKPLVSEAIAAGIAIDLRAGDWIAPHRDDRIVSFVKGLPLSALFSTRSSGTHGDVAVRETTALNIIPPAPSIAAQFNIAIGIALANKAKNNGNIVVAFTVGASNSLHHDALDFAAAHALPMLFVTHNRLPARPPARKAPKSSAIGAMFHNSAIPVIPVDAHDVVAIYRVAYESIQKARQRGGPTLIEGVTIPAEKNHEGKRSAQNRTDPIARMQAYLAAKGLFSPTWEDTIIKRFVKELRSS